MKIAEEKRPPSQARSKQTKDAILKAALCHFADQGYKGASSREIAKQAGVHHPAIKYYFGDKEALWKETVRWMFGQINTRVFVPLSQRAEKDAKERFRSFLRLYIRYCAEQPEHARIMIAETCRGGTRLEWMIETFVRVGHKEAFEVYQALMDEGVLPRVCKVSLLYAVTGICWTPFVLSKEAEILFDVDICSDEMIEQHTETVIKLLLKD